MKPVDKIEVSSQGLHKTIRLKFYREIGASGLLCIANHEGAQVFFHAKDDERFGELTERVLRFYQAEVERAARQIGMTEKRAEALRKARAKRKGAAA